MKKGIILLCISLFSIAITASAQKAALKTNAIGDVLLSPNIAAEFGLSPKWSVDVSGEVNFWTVNSHKWKHWVVQPELRYWLCERFAGHFFALHALGGQYNVGNIRNHIHHFLGTDFSKLTDQRYQGWGVGAGIGYGYDWILNDHWNLEAELGIGWIYTRSDVYPCAECGTKIESGKSHNYFGPTKVALSLVYLF